MPRCASAPSRGFVRAPELLRLIDRSARRHLERQVADPALRVGLAPEGATGCKRILLSNDYYPAFPPVVLPSRQPTGGTL